MGNNTIHSSYLANQLSFIECEKCDHNNQVERGFDLIPNSLPGRFLWFISTSGQVHSSSTDNCCYLLNPQVHSMASKDSDNEASKELQNELNQMKQKMKANLELIAMRKFPQKITQWMQLRKTLAQEIATVKNSPVACTIPVPDSLHENQAKLKASPDTVQDLLKLNPNLQCFQLNHHPQLLKNCQMSTNTAMVELIEKILPHLIELDDDLNKLDYALRLMLPRMREGEYLGTEFLHEAISQINDLQGLAQRKSLNR